MTTPADFKSIALQHNSGFDPEKLAILQRVFDKVCKEAGIFYGAQIEREALASHLLNVAAKDPSEPLLLDVEFF